MREGVHHAGRQCFDPDVVCPQPVVPEGCRTQQAPFYPPGALEWSLDLCQPVFLDPYIESEDAPLEAEAYFRPWSLHRVRALDIDQGGAFHDFVEPCRFHRVDLTISDEGYAQAAICSIPHYGQAMYGESPNQRQESYGNLIVQDDTYSGPDEDDLLKDGYAAFLGAYHAPYWTEARFSSTLTRCGATQ